MPGTYSAKFLRSSNERAEISDASQTGLNLTGDWTIEAWIKATSIVGSSDRYTLCCKYFATGGQQSYIIALHEDGNNEYRTYATSCGDGSSTYDQIYSQPGLLQPASGWHHYAWTYDISQTGADASYKYYIMGELQTVEKVVTVNDDLSSIFDGTAPFQVGAASDLGSNYSSNMQIDELRVWNVPRTQAQIRALMWDEAVGTETGLQGCWHFNNDWLDATANNNDLTPINTPTFVADDVGGVGPRAGTLVGQLAGEFNSPMGGNAVTLHFAGVGGDTQAPIIANLTPVSGNLATTRVAAGATPIEFDVTDLAPGLALVVVAIKFAGDPKRYVVHDGSDFIWPYNGPVSERTAITNGYHYKILPAMGWLDDITELFVYAVDAAGNLEGSLP